MDRTIPRLGDALIAASLLALTILMVSTVDAVSDQRPWDLLGVALTITQIVPLAWRQRAPRAVMWVSFLAWAATAGFGYPDSPSMFAVLLGLYGIAAYLPRRTALIHGGAVFTLMFAWTATGVIFYESVPWQSLPSVAFAVALPMAIGFVDYRRAQRLTALERAHTQREEAERAATIEAINGERSRIARELHDVVAHEMTVMTLQAEGARRMAGDADPRLTEALATIADSGRKGLAEMQRMIAVLRTREEAEASEPVHSVLEPMPSLAAIPSLVMQVEDSGLPVSLSITGDAHVPAGVELSAYRIIQESLTNALKYAGPGATATVEVRRRRDIVTIDVRDNGRGAAAEPSRHSGGHGLVGMRERVEALGGTIDIGPQRGGGFRVRATLPSGDDQVAASKRRRIARPVGVMADEEGA